MSWLREEDNKVITDEEFLQDCCNCSAACSEGAISMPCDGERADCPYYKKVDTSEYDKNLCSGAITRFAERMKGIEKMAAKCTLSQSDGYSQIMRMCDEIAEEMRGAE